MTGRVSVSKDALDKFIEYAEDQKAAVDMEFCVGRSGFIASDKQFAALLAALDIRPLDG